MLYWPMPNTLYVEGFALDCFAEGAWGLQPVHQNRVRFTSAPSFLSFKLRDLVLRKQLASMLDYEESSISFTSIVHIVDSDGGDEQVGLVLDAGIEEELQLRHLQVADAARATLGLPVLEYTVTDTPLQVPLDLICHIC